MGFIYDYASMMRDTIYHGAASINGAGGAPPTAGGASGGLGGAAAAAGKKSASDSKGSSPPPTGGTGEIGRYTEHERASAGGDSHSGSSEPHTHLNGGC